MSEIPKETLNCGINNQRLESLEEGMKEMKSEVKEELNNVKIQNNSQNELISHVKTAIDFMIKDKEDQKEVNKEQRDINKKTLTALQDISNTQLTMQNGLGKLATDVDDIKTKQAELDNKSKIDVTLLLKNNIEKIIGGIIGSALLMGAGYWIANK